MTMARCTQPFVKDAMELPCGKCIDCKARRVSGWSFRLLKEAEVSTSALFLTLTYDNDHVPRSKNNFKTLSKPDVQKFMKRLRKLNYKIIIDKNGEEKKQYTKLKYYFCGEYGKNTKRPHYHAIMFNVDKTTIEKAWHLDDKKIGEIHIGELTPASVGYTLKYINKGKTVPMHQNDDREPEFSLMSKGLGANYLKTNMKRWHKAKLEERMYVPLLDGKKIAMPRYYKDKIYTKLQRQHIGKTMEINALKEMRSKSYQQLDKESKINEQIRIAKWRKNNRDDRNDKL